MVHEVNISYAFFEFFIAYVVDGVQKLIFAPVASAMALLICSLDISMWNTTGIWSSFTLSTRKAIVAGLASVSVEQPGKAA